MLIGRGHIISPLTLCSGLFCDIPVLDKAVAGKTLVKLQYQVKFTPGMTTSNVIGILPGESAEEIVCYAHLDTVYNSPGANDNAASLIMVMMLAHAFSGTKPRKTLKFIATTGEEFGYLGTKHMAERRKNDGTLNNIKFIFDFAQFQTFKPHRSFYVINFDDY